ncbi:head GIN domain-containing protein [Aquirhabdus sp.]|uniref:head GIN domain-containing protein n=1 Tax=Aquirhabdus sp. TaxID=2824160 RepID=UPI00396CF14A
MKPNMLLTAMLITIPLLMSGCKITIGDSSSDEVKGSGKIVTESRKIADFTAIDIEGAANVKLRQGAVQSITIFGDDNIVPLITTSVSNGKLTINNSKSYSSDHNVDLVIVVPKIEALTVEGFSQVDLKEISSKKLDVKIDGASVIGVQGAVDSFDAEVNGAGSIDAGKLIAKAVTAEVSGAGSIKVNAVDSLDASVSGVGKVTYAGDPKLKTNISGLGSIKKI